MKLYLLLCSLLLLQFINGYFCKENEARIYGGSPAPINRFPWMVSIGQSILGQTSHVCGGVILTDTFVVTASSCLPQLILLPSLFYVRAGTNNILNETSPNEQLRIVRQIIKYPNFTTTNFLNDIALVQVSTPFDFTSSSVANISMSKLSSLENMDLISLGWGLMAPESNSSVVAPVLQQITVQENVECTKSISTNEKTQLCAPGTCLGDGGGPLVIYSNDTQKYELVGIISFRNSCAVNGLFTRIEPFIDWILITLDNPPPVSIYPTLPTMRPPTYPTPGPDILGPPIEFKCNTSSACGCSSVPVVFHDEPPFPPLYRRIQGRIVGGENAQPNSWSWMVSLRSLNIHFCGGSIINSKWILTAAHCVTDVRGIAVHIGVHNETGSSPQIRNVADIIIHSDYERPPKYVNDIALLRLATPIDLAPTNTYVGITCLPPKNAGVNYPKLNTSLAVIGWGRLLFSGARPPVLRQVRVRAIANNDSRCLGSIINMEKQFCAMVDGGGKDSCQGDSGGPIHQWIDDHWEQVGIVSFGKNCAQPTNPGIYTRLSMYHDWIESNINRYTSTTTTDSIAQDTTTTTTDSIAQDTTTTTTDSIAQDTTTTTTDSIAQDTTTTTTDSIAQDTTTTTTDSIAQDTTTTTTDSIAQDTTTTTSTSSTTSSTVTSFARHIITLYCALILNVFLLSMFAN